MTYPGNAALSEEIRQRVLTTFRQALDLTEKGSRQEALLGCDFILRLDPLFEPARVLQQRLRASAGSVEVDDLRQPGEAASTPEADRAELRERFLGCLERREFQAAMALGDGHRRQVQADPELRNLLTLVRARAEAEPYVLGFLDTARLALQEGQDARAEQLIAKAKALDPTHPGVGELEGLRSHYADPERTMGARRSGSSAAASLSEPPPPTGGPPASGSAADGTVPGGPDDLDLPVFDLTGLGMDATLPEEGLDAETFTASVGTAEGDARIAVLLEEGQQAFDRAEYQGAIDAWSRIFLIDIDHVEASRRIDHARKLKDEQERRVEEAFHDAQSLLDAGRLEEAAAGLEQVLAMQPSHLAAQQTLDGLRSEARTSVPPQPDGPAGAQRREPAPPLDIPLSPEPPRARRRPGDEAASPPAGARPEARRPPLSTPPAAPSRGRGIRRSFVTIGGVVLALVVVGGWYLYSHREQFFPNSEPVEATPGTAQPDPIERARRLHKQGRTPIAVAQLRRVPPESAHYAEAQALVAQWEAMAATVPGLAATLPAEAQGRRDEHLGAARTAAGRGEFLRALEEYAEAAEIQPLSEGDADARRLVEERLDPLRPQIVGFRQGEWEFHLSDLWKLLEEDPGNQDVRRLLVDSYHNLGVRDLQRGRPASAADRFKEALALAPEDPELLRLQGFAQTYEERSQDLLYRIFVKYLPFR